MKTALRLLGPFVAFIGIFQLYLAKRADIEAKDRGIIYVATGSVILMLSVLAKNDRQNRS